MSKSVSSTKPREAAAIDRAGCGRGEKSFRGAADFEPVADVFFLGRKVELSEHGAAIGGDQREVFAAFSEREIGVQRFGWIGEVVAGSEHDQVAVGGDVGAGGECPGGPVRGVVAEMVAGE